MRDRIIPAASIAGFAAMLAGSAWLWLASDSAAPIATIVAGFALFAFAEALRDHQPVRIK